MREILIEHLISVKRNNASYFKMGLMIAVDILVVYISYLFILFPFVAIILLPIAGCITYVVFRNQDLEYEYSLINNQLDIDRIYAKKLRKKGMSFELERMEIMGDDNTHSLNNYGKNKIKGYDFTSRDPEAKVYTIRFVKGNETFDLYFEPTEEMIEAIKYLYPRKVDIK